MGHQETWSSIRAAFSRWKLEYFHRDNLRRELPKDAGTVPGCDRTGRPAFGDRCTDGSEAKKEQRPASENNVL